MSAVKNRLEKNLKKLKPWAKRHSIEAFRLFDRDIPEYPYIVDIYGNQPIVFDRRDDVVDADPKKVGHYQEIIQALATLFELDPEKIIVKRRNRDKGGSKYGRLSHEGLSTVVREGVAKFSVNLTDYLDTGLFLDHRILRERVNQESKGKRVLNLFAYTGSFSVFAALGGGTVTTVDMSNTYIEWAKENFKLNGLSTNAHNFVVEDVFQYIKEIAGRQAEKYDLIILDPPTFSNSKSMAQDFEIGEDHQGLIRLTMKHLDPKGVLYFSNNKRDFRMSEKIIEEFKVRDITLETIPSDFRDTKIHRVFEIRSKVPGSFPGTR